MDASGNESAGTGYLFEFCNDGINHVPCIVTNRHLVNDAVSGFFTLTRAKDDGSADVGNYEVIHLPRLQDVVIGHPDGSVDLVAIVITSVLRRAIADKKLYFYVTLRRQDVADDALLSTLSPIEDVVVIGHPTSLWDARHNMPVVRRGITASHARLPWNGRPEFLIDAACFPGASGSPVFLANRTMPGHPPGGTAPGTRMALLGTLWGGPALTREGNVVTAGARAGTQPVAADAVPMNLGFVIQVAALTALEDEIRKIRDSLFRKPQHATARSRNSPCVCGSGKRYKECCGVIL